MRNKLFTRIIITTLLVTLLTFNVGRVIRVEAVATTAAIAGAALLGTGAIYLGYLALTGATVSIPSGTSADIQDYLRDVGRKVAYYGSGAVVYNKVYSFLRNHGIGALNDYVVTWSQSDLLDLYNDFKDIDLLQDISSFVASTDYSQIATNGFDYQFSFSSISLVDNNGNSLLANGYSILFPNGVNVVEKFGNLASIISTHSVGTFRNYHDSTGYYVQQFISDSWEFVDITFQTYVDQVDSSNNHFRYYSPSLANDYYVRGTGGIIDYGYPLTYPALPNEVIYDSELGEDLPMVIPSGDLVPSPQYDNNDDDNGRPYPIVPYVQLPDGGNWGFNLGDLISEIVNRAAQTITAIGIGSLINQFMNSLGGDTGDYIYYSDNDNNYYIYYSNVYQGDDYSTYNINVSDQQEVIPVDLNTIKQYTDNQYLDVVRERVDAFSDTVGSFVAFWHNIDYEIVYAVFGSALIVLLGAFIGKWGH